MGDQRPWSKPPVPEETNRVAAEVVDAAFHVHSGLGPGLLESVYQACLAYDLAKRGLSVRTEVRLPIVYDDLRIDSGLRLDIVVNDCVVVEPKTVEEVLPVHHAQILTYLKLSGMRVGLLLNFNVGAIKDGIKRFVV